MVGIRERDLERAGAILLQQADLVATRVAQHVHRTVRGPGGLALALAKPEVPSRAIAASRSGTVQIGRQLGAGRCSASSTNGAPGPNRTAATSVAKARNRQTGAAPSACR